MVSGRPYVSIALAMLGLAVIQPALAGPVADSASPSWTGPFLGIQGGLAGAKITYTEDAVPNVSEAVVYQFADKRAVYSIHAGYDQEFSDRGVWGVEISADWLGFDIDPFSSGGLGNLFSGDYSVSATSRVGLLADPSTLVYARGGISVLSVSAESGLNQRTHALLPAAVFGAGIETLITRNMSARVEGTYTLPLRRLRVPADSKSFDPRFIKITAGLSWRLDADQPSEREVAVVADDDAFRGFYVGTIAGYNLGRMVTPVNTPGATVGPFASEGGLFGITAGADTRLEGLVVGAGVELAKTEAKFYDPGQNSPLQGSTKLFASIDGTAMVTGRVGFVATPGTLVYAKGGIGVLRTTANPEFFTFDSGGTKLLLGHTIGGGVEAMVTDNLSVKLEGCTPRPTAASPWI